MTLAMPETLVDRPPPTLRDDALPAPAPPPAPPASKGRALAIGLSIFAAVLLVASVAFYLFVWRYEPVARKHIPGNANLVMRFEFADIALFGPVRDHFWPLLFEHRGELVKGKSSADRVKEATGVDIATDVRELYVASADATSWVLILGGKLKRGHYVQGLAGLAKEDAWAGWHLEGELFLGPGGAAIAQADDGTLLLGSNRDVVMAAIPASEDYKRLALPEKGAATFAITHEAWEGAAGAAVVAHASVLRKIERASGQFSLGKAPELSMEIEPAQGTAAPALAGEIEQLLAEMRIVSMLVPEQAGEKGALQAARVSNKNERVTVTAPWSYEALDKACAKLAGAMKPAAAH
jgi:hypothetical protein